MRKKTLIGILLCLVVALSLTVGAASAGVVFPMEYLPGTADPAVTDLPPADSGTGGEEYGVAAGVPQRQGYEFIDWTLDYETASYTLTYRVFADPVTHTKPTDAAEPAPVTGIVPGGNVTLSGPLTTGWNTPDGQPEPTPYCSETYTVYFKDINSGDDIADPWQFRDAVVGDVISVFAPDMIGDLTLVGDTEQRLEICRTQQGIWTFTGWCSDEACTVPVTEVTDITADTTVYGKWEYREIEIGRNEIVYYYEYAPAPERVSYTVRYILMETGELMCEDKTVENVEPGTHAVEEAREFPGYKPIEEKIEWYVVGGETKIFIYYADNAPIF